MGSTWTSPRGVPRCASLTAILALQSAEPVSATVRGVSPEDQAKYDRATFQCLNGEGAVSASAVNDDFCDCADGSDEPGTSACAGHLQTLFYCVNEGSVPSYVYSSRVNDGVCDCCDGGDEWAAAEAAGAARPTGSARSSPCSNTCAAEGREIFRDRAAREADLKSGISQRKALIQEARRSRSSSQEELTRLKEDLPRLDKVEAEAKSSLEAAQRAKNEADRREKELASNDTVLAEAPAGDRSGSPDQAEAAGSADSASGDVPAAAAGDGAAAEGKAVISEYTKWMEGAEEALDDEHGEAEYEEMEHMDDHLNDDPEDENEVAVDHTEPGFLARQWRSLCGTLGGAWRALVGEAKAETALEKAQKVSSEAKKRAADARRRIEELERKVGGEVPEDEETLAYDGLDDTCISKSIGGYKYEVCFFKSAKQDHISVGRWKRWEAPGVALFDGGQYCPGGPERSLRVLFACGPKEELVDVAEPSRCTYEATVRHPAACTESLLQALQTKGARMPHDEL